MKADLSWPVQDSLQRITFGSDDETVLAAASELRELGIEYRGGINPRGTSEKAAESLLPPQVQEKLLIALQSKSGVVRNQLLLALSNWLDGSLNNHIAEILLDEPSNLDLHSCILALQTVGGEEASILLRRIADQSGSDEYIVRAARLAAQRVERGSYDISFGPPSKSSIQPSLPPLNIPSDLLVAYAHGDQT